MVVKLASKKVPHGFQPSEFRYVGRPAADQGDFGPEVGIVDMIPVDAHGADRGSRYFHIGVVEARGEWFVYMESGPLALRRSWFGNRAQPTLEFMFTRCRDRAEAHRFLRRQCMNMNFGRITQKRVGEKRVWVARTRANGEVENAWLVTEPKHPERGLPQAEPESVETNVVPIVNWQPQAPVRADVVVRGILHDARTTAQGQGVVPTLEALAQVGEELLPLVMRRIAELSAPKRGIMMGAMEERPRAHWTTVAN